MDARNLPADQLNERRREAVRLRLAGMTVAAVSAAVRLSAPTVIAAHKAYLAGGWDAVLLRRRGRAAGSGRKLDTAIEKQLLATMFEHSTDALDAPQALWSDESIARWFERKGLTVPPRRSLARYRAGWGLHPVVSDEEEARLLALMKSAARDHAAFWCGAQASAPRVAGEAGHWFLFARGTRGQLYWSALPHAPRTHDWTHFWQRLAATVTRPLHLFLSGLALTPRGELDRWMSARTPPIRWTSVPMSPGTAAVAAGTAYPPSAVTRSTAQPAATPHHSAIKARAPMQTTPEAIDPDTLTHLQRLEAESIHIMREVVAEAENPVMLYSIGKDSAVMLHLAMKAFYPAVPPFPLLHVDTTWKFKAMYQFRDEMAKKLGMDLIVHINQDGVAKGINPFTHGSAIHTDIMKTEALKQALDKYGFDVAFGGARRDEEKSRAKERVFSFRTAQHRWDPKNQRPELWNLYNARKHKGESIRAFPISNWTELDIWQYIYLQNIPIVPLYFSAPRPVVERDGTLIMVDDERMPLRAGEVPQMKSVRFRTLGCYPLTGAVESTAATLTDIIQEMLLTKTSERQGRVIDHDSAGSMEKKKQEGYF